MIKMSIYGDKLNDCDGEEIPCKTMHDIDKISEKWKCIGELAVYFIAKMGDIKLLKYALEKLHNTYYSYDIVIKYAAIGGQRDTVEYLYQRASMAEYHIYWEWAIKGAAIGGHLDLVKEYEQRAIINEENINWEYLLYFPHDIQVIKYICEKILIEGGTIPVKILSILKCSDDEELKEYLNGLE